MFKGHLDLEPHAVNARHVDALERGVGGEEDPAATGRMDHQREADQPPGRLPVEGQPMRDPDSTTYVGTFEDCRHLGSLLRAEALRRGLASAQRTVYLGGGAPWIWENARIPLLNAQHAKQPRWSEASH